MKKKAEKDKKVEYLVDDTPPDIEGFMATHTPEEIKKMYQEVFGDKKNEESEEE